MKRSYHISRNNYDYCRRMKKKTANYLDILCIKSLTNFVWFHDLLPLHLSGSLLYVVTYKIEPHNIDSEKYYSSTSGFNKIVYFLLKYHFPYRAKNKSFEVLTKMHNGLLIY